MNNGYIMLGVLQSYAPDAKAQQWCTEAYNTSRATDMTDDQIVRLFCGCISDGLRFGNWPWNGPKG